MKADNTSVDGAQFSNIGLLLPAVCLIVLLLAGLAGRTPPERISLTFLGSQQVSDTTVGFMEPSGLSPASEGGFWSVSDNAAHLFRLDGSGKKLGADKRPVASDLEGIVEDAKRKRLLAVKEDTAEILLIEDNGVTGIPLLSLVGAELLNGFFSVGGNDGLEGITVEPETGTVFLLKERAPRLLIEISADLATIRRVIPLSRQNGFVPMEGSAEDFDVSGITWDARRKGFWIISDTGHAVFFFSAEDLYAHGWALITAHGDTFRAVENAEGVALGQDGTLLHVVTDDKENSRFLTYRID
jgi:uncharacterized protein YjiK